MKRLIFISCLCMFSWSACQSPAELSKCCDPNNSSGLWGNTIEVVTSEAQPNNKWGGQQNRIVRNAFGVFTTYIVEGTGSYSHLSTFDREWHLAKRENNGQWRVIAKGPSGRDCADLLSAPNGNLYIIANPNMTPSLWEINPDGTIIKDNFSIPGDWQNSKIPQNPDGLGYTAAGISSNGNIVVLQSETYYETHKFYWSYYNAKNNSWHSYTRDLSKEKRHCYTYVFPGDNGDLSLVSTRDVKWETLGLCPPKGAFEYVFNSVGYFHTANAISKPDLDYLQVREAKQVNCEFVGCHAQTDNYLDTKGRIHILYWYQDAQTPSHGRHAIVENGAVVKDVALPENAGGGYSAAIIQDDLGKFYLITANGEVYPSISEDGTVWGDHVAIDLGGYNVEYSGFFLAVPRGGTALTSYVDGGFITDGGKKWIYFRHHLRKQ